MLEKKVREYFECEYNLIKNIVDYQHASINKEISVRLAIQRCLGVAQFAESLGDDLSNIEVIFEEYKKKFEEIIS